ncbi:MBL fold metallo-hydrolase, partial [candidate division KSB1 bacterium]|nr:MBL fold metallo-hydrolase [candidate division KSB1 bacterium]
MKHDKMILVILGSGTCIPTQKRGMPGLIVKTGTENLLFDGGTGSLHRLEKAGAEFRDLNYLFYTHMHSDHTLDLVALLQAIKVDPFHDRTRPLHIHGPEGFSHFVNTLADAFGKWLILPDDYEVNVRELSAQQLDYPFGRITSAPMQHSKAAIGYRLDTPDGRSITYSGDTDYCEEII